MSVKLHEFQRDFSSFIMIKYRGHLKAHHDLHVTAARSGKATRLDARRSIVPAVSELHITNISKLRTIVVER